ncbi:MAG: peptide chain release factor N(5)-glutamine methyltransferase [Congregibacter sp.]|nr:peptide chain release factor N(5)-glutamine methyltransferase [Congregibacter sp.]
MSRVRELLAEHSLLLRAPTPDEAARETVQEIKSQATHLDPADARRDAEVLLCTALNKSRSYLLAWPDAEVDDAVAERYRGWLAQRCRGVPVAYLLGIRDFWSLSLQVNPATLIPRADTELLVERSLALGLGGRAQVLDLGTGSGAIALALARERPYWRVTAVEQSAQALQVAIANGRALGLDQSGRLEWLQGSWFTGLSGRRFDLIVSNPPYIAADDGHLVRGDLRFEPRSALVSGVDGLDDIRVIITQAPDYLHPRGQLLLEHGFEQGEAVRGLLVAAGFAGVCSYRDLAGHERVSGGALAGP